MTVLFRKNSAVRQQIMQLFYSILLYLLFRDEDSLESWTPAFRSVEPLFNIGYIYLLWEGNRQIALFWDRKFPGFESTIRRLIRQILSCTVYIFLLALLLFKVYVFFDIVVEPSLNTLKFNFLYGLLISYLVIAIYEGADFYKGWKTHLTRSETLAREKSEIQLALVDAQLSALRDQLNPHFLFNSLNTLSSLIDLKNKKAITYLEQLADVYRYILEHREKDLVSLGEELTFAQTYISLNKSRFRDDLFYEVALNDVTDAARLPPYALQLALENAIKHNAVSPGKPLKITVTDEEDYLVVTNNKRPRSVLAPSTGMGLKNLQHRCMLVTGRPVYVVENDRSFIVKVPFICQDVVSEELVKAGNPNTSEHAHSNY